MNIEIKPAKTSGFCYGVERAVNRAAQLGSKAVTYGELTHNNDVLRDLEESGIRKIDRISDCPRDKTLLIRSHGISLDEYAEIHALNLSFEDMTCPHVTKIHNIVAKHSAEGKTIIIAGDKKHPEVRGILGHCLTNSDVYTANNEEELEALFHSEINFRHNALILVAQTTFVRAKWINYKNFLKKHCTNLQIFDTICSTTIERQEEAEKLSRECDLMIVLGSHESSNSRKLADICGKNTQTVFIENKSQLDIKEVKRLLKLASFNKYSACLAVGLIAGASTPRGKQEEVHKIMNEELKGSAVVEEDINGDIDFMAEIDKTFKRVYIGNRVKATVVAVNRSEAVVDIGTKHSGYIPADELSNDASKLPIDIVNKGDVIDCVVISINDAEGIVTLSKKKVDSALGLEKIAKAADTGETLTGTVAAAVKGGVIVVCEGAKVFVPASQSGVPKTGKLEDLVKKEVGFKIIEVNESRGRIVGSIRSATKEVSDAKREAFWSSIEEGKRYKGEVKSMESYGVFVDLGGVDGMVHLSELTWNRVRHPKDVVSVGDKLDVYVKSFDPEKRRVSLGAKDPEANPWSQFVKDYSAGDTVNVEIVSITPFGAFAQILPGIDGLIHISQISRERVANVAQVLSVGDKIDAQITDIDEEKNRISLSIKALLEPLPEEESETEGDSPREQSEVVYSDDDVKPDEATGELTPQAED